MKPLFLTLIILSLSACDKGGLNWTDVNTEIQEKFPKVERITVDELNSKNVNNIILVDVRKPEEFAISRIPGAVNLADPFDIAELASQPDKELIVYCSVGYRSAAVVHELNNLGINNVKNLQGSIFVWANKDLPLVNDAGSTREVHPYDDYWGQLLE